MIGSLALLTSYCKNNCQRTDHILSSHQVIVIDLYLDLIFVKNKEVKN